MNLMSDQRLDFHSTFRRLSFFRPSLVDPVNTNHFEEFINSLLELTSEPERLERERAFDSWRKWLKDYAERIESERGEWGVKIDAHQENGSALEDTPTQSDVEREKAAKAANPRFVLRQWVLEEVIKAVEKDPKTGKRILRKVLQVSS